MLDKIQDAISDSEPISHEDEEPIHKHDDRQEHLDF